MAMSRLVPLLEFNRSVRSLPGRGQRFLYPKVGVGIHHGLVFGRKKGPDVAARVGLLMGENKYTLTFEPSSFKEPAFWSATMYDFNNNYTVENPINRYAADGGNIDCIHLRPPVQPVSPATRPDAPGELSVDRLG